jgi:hypothetical protein
LLRAGNQELLVSELHALNGERFDLALTGFSEELDRLLDELTNSGALDQVDEVPEPPVHPVTRPGEPANFGCSLHIACCACAANGRAAAAPRRQPEVRPNYLRRASLEK